VTSARAQPAEIGQRGIAKIVKRPSAEFARVLGRQGSASPASRSDRSRTQMPIIIAVRLVEELEVELPPQCRFARFDPDEKIDH